MQKYGQISGPTACTVFAGYGRYLLLPETHEIEGDTLHVSRTGLQYPLSVSLIYLLRVYIRAAYMRKTERDPAKIT